jgi:hypothetical protein
VWPPAHSARADEIVDTQSRRQPNVKLHGAAVDDTAGILAGGRDWFKTNPTVKPSSKARGLPAVNVDPEARISRINVELHTSGSRDITRPRWTPT